MGPQPEFKRATKVKKEHQRGEVPFPPSIKRLNESLEKTIASDPKLDSKQPFICALRELGRTLEMQESIQRK